MEKVKLPGEEGSDGNYGSPITQALGDIMKDEEATPKKKEKDIHKDSDYESIMGGAFGDKEY